LQAKSEEHLAQEQAWLASERVWLLHRGGFTPASRCGSADPDTGKLRIRLITSGEELLVDEEDVEKVAIESAIKSVNRGVSLAIN
jgi:myosin-18